MAGIDLFEERIVARGSVRRGPLDERTALLLSFLLLAAGYFLAGKIGLYLAVGNASVSVVWPPTGIAIAALLLWGSELWPAVFVGAFLVNLTTTWDPASSLAIASGNSLEALVGAFLARRYAGGTDLFTRPQTVILFALLSGFLASSIAATVGTTTLVAAHLAPMSQSLEIWGRWWIGDAVGAIEFTPLIVAVFQRVSAPHPVLSSPGWGEAAVVGLGVVTLAAVVFGRDRAGPLGVYPLIFLVLPPTIWAAIRFGPIGATLSASAVSLIAIIATVGGRGPFGTLPADVALLGLRVFIGSVVLTVLLISSEVTQHHRLERALYRARKELQSALQARTYELDAAKSIGNIGTWSFDLRTRKLVWSDEMYRILGYGEGRFPVEIETALDRVHPADRAQLRTDLDGLSRAAPGSGPAFVERRLRLRTAEGEPRTVMSRIQVTQVEDGHALRISGTVQDITERQRIEDELRALRSDDDRADPGGGDFLLWMVPWIKERR